MKTITEVRKIIGINTATSILCPVISSSVVSQRNKLIVTYKSNMNREKSRKLNEDFKTRPISEAVIRIYRSGPKSEATIKSTKASSQIIQPPPSLISKFEYAMQEQFCKHLALQFSRVKFGSIQDLVVSGNFSPLNF